MIKPTTQEALILAREALQLILDEDTGNETFDASPDAPWCSYEAESTARSAIVAIDTALEEDDALLALLERALVYVDEGGGVSLCHEIEDALMAREQGEEV